MKKDRKGAERFKRTYLISITMIRFTIPQQLPEEMVVPSVSIMRKKIVIVKNDQYQPISDGEKPLAPEEIVEDLLKRFSRVHILDLLGIQRDAPQWDVIKNLCEVGPIWADVGAATSDSVIDVIMAGAEAAVLSLKFLESLDEVASALELTDNVVVQIDLEERILGPDKLKRFRGMKELIQELSILGVKRIIIYDHKNKPDGSLPPTTPKDVELYWAAKTLKEGEEALNAGYSGTIVSLGHLLGGEG
ncbi:MAG: hypothetical protein J7L88_03560 [Thermoplasmata archaeon]|nr:hypothetical protein [Thermoplasmata archaeon]